MIIFQNNCDLIICINIEIIHHTYKLFYKRISRKFESTTMIMLIYIETCEFFNFLLSKSTNNTNVLSRHQNHLSKIVISNGLD